MSVKVTLELPDELAARAQAAAVEMGLSFEDALVHWLGQAGWPAETSQDLPKPENALPKGTYRRTLVWCVLAPCLMLLVAAIVVWCLPRPGISEANYKRVKLGMSASEVGDILGPRYLKGWDRVEREADISELLDRRVFGFSGSALGDRPEEWEDDELIIRVRFSLEDRRVTGKELLAVHTPPGLFPKLRSWLGW